MIYGISNQRRHGHGILDYLYRGNLRLYVFYCNQTAEEGKKKQQELLSSIAIGDSVLTTSGFYGVIIDMTDDTVIVEFGNNKNCRIPMQKAAIVQVEKPEV